MSTTTKCDFCGKPIQGETIVKIRGVSCIVRSSITLLARPLGGFPPEDACLDCIVEAINLKNETKA